MAGSKTSTKTETANGVTTTTTTVTSPGQPTKITTVVKAAGQPTRTTIKTITTKLVPVSHNDPEDQIPMQPDQPMPEGRPHSPSKQPAGKRISGFMSSIKKVLPKRSSSPVPTQSSPKLAPKQPVPQKQQPPPPQQYQQQPLPAQHYQQQPQPQQKYQQQPQPQQKYQQQPQPQQKYQQQPQPHSQPPTPQPTKVIRIQGSDPSVEPIIEKLRKAELGPSHGDHRHTTSTTIQNGKVIAHKISCYHDDSPDDAISTLKKCRTIVASDFNGKRLDVRDIDFSREDGHARACPNSEATTIPRLSHYLTSPFAGNQLSQLRAIFAWITDNIAYDVPSFMSGRYGDQSPEGVLRNRQSVCEGYANLYVALAEPAGLDVRKVIGLSRGVDVQVGDDRLGSPHAWNAVTVNGEHLLIDSTWGAGVCDLATRSFRKSYRPFFFLIRPNKMIYTHWPDESKNQYLDPPVNEDTFRGLPAVKPEAWMLGIKLAGKNRGQVIHSKDDYVQVDVRLKKRATDGATGKIVARLHWKGQAIPAAVQWSHEDSRYVFMTVKTWCPSGGTGELHFFGWPPGGDQTKNGPQCMVFKVVNDGSGRGAKPLLQQYVVKGFSFSVLEPMTAQVKKNAQQTIRIRVFDVEKGTTPALALQAPDGGMPERLPQVQPGMFEMTKTLEAGQWKIVHMTSEYGFSFAAVFDAV
ncbi:hypothetical protein BGZ65_003348 [Modicella reniformis]|uniref:Transglutaminase-like domain-containing protein n=1 Tax=Modicella reniformis TaxID=1440133 RepID=A0A9P6LT27_9FUNG|nr:hypothetical protein BGZ65_003348 [Modicella reniformis]